jgi:pyruvate formate lyase activating enzyme
MSATGIVFDIQRFCIHDGPGIRTMVFFKGCALRCRWCQNPEGLNPQVEISFTRERCVGCRECAKVCPLGAIMLEKIGRIDRGLCDRCGKCVEVCCAAALQVVGRAYTGRQLLEEVTADMPFFSSSGGGITLSGGEPTYQAAFLAGFLRLCRERGLHVALETCGHVSRGALEQLLPLVDLILYDIKAVNSALHLKLTGVNNELILANLERVLADHRSKVMIRVPLIPALTATARNLLDIARLLKRHHIRQVVVLPYHSMGEGKLEKMNGVLKPLHLPAITEQELTTASSIFRSEGIQVRM